MEIMIPNDDPVRLLSAFVEEMDLSELYNTYTRIRKNQATPEQLLKIMIYAFMNGLRSSRDIEKACRRDINYMYLLEGNPAPDHATIARFISVHMAGCSKNLLSECTGYLKEIGEISGKTIFIDGTKIEANANRYSFVWKRAVNKNLEKLMDKIMRFVLETEKTYGFEIAYKNRTSLHALKRIRKKLKRIQKERNIQFVHGSGKRKTAIQRSIETLDRYIDKLKEYTQKRYICGMRSSYSKTDHDATFMRLKEDAMRNGQLKPAYNMQHGVDSQYITWVDISASPTDTPTLIPLLKDMEEHLGFKYAEIVADAGYESEEIYAYIEENQQTAYIKPTNYEISKTRKYQHDISRRENMDYHPDTDTYTCSQQRCLHATGEKRERTASGYQRQVTIYECEDCSGCPQKTKCIRGNHCRMPMEERNKRMYVSRKFERQRADSLNRITTAYGVQLRVNRSIQVEGSFAYTKEDLGLRQYSYRGTDNVLAESVITAMAYNIWKLHYKIQGKRTGISLIEMKESA